ncbi:MAG: GatB/YqeY domain-containing protein [Alkalilacustris sp.]
MDLRTRIRTALTEACAEGDTPRAATLRLIAAAIRDRERALRSEGQDIELSNAALRDILVALASRRRATARTFEENGRLEQAAEKSAEADIIEELLPRPLRPGEVDRAIGATLSRLGARSLRDIGRVMAELRPQLDGQLPAAELKARVRARLE